jgi:hypothetical protein
MRDGVGIARSLSGRGRTRWAMIGVLRWVPKFVLATRPSAAILVISARKE